MKENTVDVVLPHFASRTCSSCNDEGKALFTLEALSREILNNNKAIGVTMQVLSSWRDARLLCRDRCLLFSRRVPYQWKLANLTPNDKKGSRKLWSKFRPVSLTSNICKIFESILTRVMHGHLELNKLISIEQHGFVSSKACVTDLLEFLDLTTNGLHKHR